MIGCAAGETEFLLASSNTSGIIKGRFEAIKVVSFKIFRLDVRPAVLEGEQLDPQIFDAKIDLSSNGSGTISSAAMCKELMILNPPPHTWFGVHVLESYGLNKRIGLLTTMRAVFKCSDDSSAGRLVSTVVRTEPALEARRMPRTNLQINSGFIGFDTSTFAADRFCRKLVNKKIITLKTGLYENEHLTACVGFKDNSGNELRMILLAPLARYATMADYRRRSEQH